MSAATPLARRENNFDALRLVAAVSVIFSHSFLIADGNENNEPLIWLTGRRLRFFRHQRISCLAELGPDPGGAALPGEAVSPDISRIAAGAAALGLRAGALSLDAAFG